MRQQIVVAITRALSERDATAITRAHGQDTDYHLMVGAQWPPSYHGESALLGIRPGDTFGSPALARRMDVPPPGEDPPANDLGRIMAVSAQRLRAATAGEVTVAITHGDILVGARSLVETAGGQAVVVVTDPEIYPQFALPDRKQRLGAYLQVDSVQVVQHSD